MRKLFANASHTFSTKQFGSMKKEDKSIDLENIQRFLTEKKLAKSFIGMHQIHGNTLSIITDNKQKLVPDADGLITQTKNVNLCILTADCLPIFFYDPKKEVIAAVHAGRKGLLKKIIQECISLFKTKYKSNILDIQVSIGPSIEKKCYEVGREILEQFEKEFEWFDQSFYDKSKNDRYLLDLRKIALQSLIKEGILSEHIEISELCTKCETEMLYSYRRGDKAGRFVSAICLV